MSISKILCDVAAAVHKSACDLNVSRLTLASDRAAHMVRTIRIETADVLRRVKIIRPLDALTVDRSAAAIVPCERVAVSQSEGRVRIGECLSVIVCAFKVSKRHILSYSKHDAIIFIIIVWHDLAQLCIEIVLEHLRSLKAYLVAEVMIYDFPI